MRVTTRFLACGLILISATIAWAQDGIIYASAEDITSKIDERADLSYAYQVYSRMSCGSVRMDGDKVHECLNKVA